MKYVLTIWLFWASAETVLINVTAPSCEVALNTVLQHVEGDGVTEFYIVSCGVSI